MNLCLQHGKRHAHVRRMHGNAGLACAEDRVHAVETVDGRAAGARLALVAWRGEVVEIGTARPLQRDCRRPRPCCAIAATPRTAAHSPAPDSAAPRARDRQGRSCAPAHRCASRHPPSLRPCPTEVSKCRSALPAARHPSHQIDQVGAAGDELAPRACSDLAQRVGDVGQRANTRSSIMAASSPAGSPLRCWCRHRSGRYCRSSIRGFRTAVLALPSAIRPTAEQIWPGVQ